MAKVAKEQISIKKVREWLAKLDRRMLIQNSIFGAILLIIVFVGVVPVFITNQKMIGEVRELQSHVRDATVRISKIPAMKKEKEFLSKRAEIVRQKFFKMGEIDQLIEIISSTAQKAGIRITASRPSNLELKLEAPFDKLYTAVSYDLSIEGSYHQIGWFFNGLERYGKSFIIPNFYLKGKDARSGILQSNFVLAALIERVGK